MRLSKNSLIILKKRYLKRDTLGRVVESPLEMFQRVAQNIASAEALYNLDGDIKKREREFFEVMCNLEFLPNSPTLMNAGRELQQLAACFVLPVEDSLESIFEAIKNTAIIHQTGGGTGFSFSSIRPKNDTVLSTCGIASGPMSFMKVFNMATEVIKQGGARRGANMGVLRIDHPDIIDFIRIKANPNELNNFNISVGITDNFMGAYYKRGDYCLINPRNEKRIKKVSAKRVFDMVVEMAWRSGDPGLIFLNKIDRDNPTPDLGKITATNPCGEQPLLPYEACNLGSINLSKMIASKGGRVAIDYDKLGEIVRIGIRFLDNVIDVNRYPLPQIEKMTKGNRKIGLGVMGFADMLIKLDIQYNSQDALDIAERIMSFIREMGYEASAELAKERGVFPNFTGSIYDRSNGARLRNATVTTIAPTGTLNIIANCSSGIEPIYSVNHIRTALDNIRLKEIHPLFIKVAKKNRFYSKKLIDSLNNQQGSIQGISDIPEEIRSLFVTSYDIEPEYHVKMQAAFQRYTDNAVSKTINFPENARKKDIRDAFLLAYKEGCKGITIYRDKSKDKQVLTCSNLYYC